MRCDEEGDHAMTKSIMQMMAEAVAALPRGPCQACGEEMILTHGRLLYCKPCHRERELERKRNYFNTRYAKDPTLRAASQARYQKRKKEKQRALSSAVRARGI